MTLNTGYMYNTFIHADIEIRKTMESTEWTMDLCFGLGWTRAHSAITNVLPGFLSPKHEPKVQVFQNAAEITIDYFMHFQSTLKVYIAGPYTLANKSLNEYGESP